MCLRQGDPRAVLAAAGFPAGSTDEYEKEASFLGTHGDPWVPKCTLNPIWSDEEQLFNSPPLSSLGHSRVKVALKVACTVIHIL